MSTMPGWYPDPAGTPGQFRYWDGSTWSSQTTANPAATPAPPRGGAPLPPGPEGQRRGGRGWIAAIVALALLVAVVLVWRHSRSTSAADAPVDTNTSTPTVSAWNETSSPTPQPSDSSGPPSPSNGALTSCPVATPLTFPDGSDSSRLYGGHISVQGISGWDADPSGFVRWATDVQAENTLIANAGLHSWMSNIGVGALEKAEGFTTPEQAARGFMSCLATSSYYDGFTGRTDNSAQAITIDGKQGFWLRSTVTVDFPDPNIKGDVIDVVVVETGDPDVLSFYEGNATIDDQTVQTQVDQVRESIKVES